MNPSENSSRRPAGHQLPRTAYDPSRPVSAVIIGAGIAGIATSILLQAKVPNLSYTVFERHERVGGTWQENQYPGVRCDVPSHSYQLSFEPNPHWTEFYAGGAEIREYYESTVHKYGIDKNLRLRHEVVQAAWHVDNAKWYIRVRDLARSGSSGDEYTVEADFLVSATGRLNSATLPDIPGIDAFQGPVMHTARWDNGVGLDGKRVAVIGNGASGMQIVPAILPHVQHIAHFARTRNWVSAAFNGGLSTFAAEAGSPGGHQFSRDERDRFAADADAYLVFRKSLDATFHQGFAARYKDSNANAMLRNSLTAMIADRVGHDEALLAKLIPDYAPGCKRLTPAPGYLEALRSDKISYVTERITKIRDHSIETADGTVYKVDAIVVATGFPERYASAFPIYGRNGADLRDVWSPSGHVGYPKSYFGVMAPNFPNFFFVLQTQGTALGGTVPVQCEQTATYIAQCVRKIQSQSYTALEPSEEATDDFDAVVEGFFADKVTTDGCSSWWKQGSGPSRVTVSWPGTGHHKWSISRCPRWEDFLFHRRKDAAQNRFHYFHSGLTAKEKEGDPEVLTAYLNTKADLQSLHESWTQGY